MDPITASVDRSQADHSPFSSYKEVLSSIQLTSSEQDTRWHENL